MKRLGLLLLVLLGFSTGAVAGADDLRVTPQQAYDRVQAEGDELLFIDVRDPVEIMFVGSTDEVHANIPFRLVDRTHWNAEAGVFAMPKNPDFAAEVEAALAERGLDRDATVITMCRSGSDRGRPSAEYLREAGFSNALYVENGFQGDPIEAGERAGMRLQNGWQNSGLPWSREINPEKIYRPGD